MTQKLKIGQQVRVTCNFDGNTIKDKVGEVLFTWEGKALIGFFCGGVRTNHSFHNYKHLYRGLKATWSVPYQYLTTTVISKNKFR